MMNCGLEMIQKWNVGNTYENYKVALIPEVIDTLDQIITNEVELLERDRFRNMVFSVDWGNHFETISWNGC